MTNAIKIHPVADLFPMLGEEELAELAASIKEQGVLTPIVLDEKGRVLDGRNRLAACKLAKVEPIFQQYEGDDPDTYALTVNIARRHMSKGSLAMVAASSDLINKSGDLLNGKDLARAIGVSAAYFSWASTVSEWAPELVQAVVGGAALKDAYEFAHARKVDADNAEKTEAERADKEAQLALKTEEKLEAKREAIRKTVEAIGPPTALPQIPSIERAAKEAFQVAQASGDEEKTLDAQDSNMTSLRLALERLDKFVPDVSTSNGDQGRLYLDGVWSAVTKLINAAAEIAKQCDMTVTESKALRRVK